MEFRRVLLRFTPHPSGKVEDDAAAPTKHRLKTFVVPATSFFFFSSRRRHTRYWRDWSSDVCSSDLPPDVSVAMALPEAGDRLRSVLLAFYGWYRATEPMSEKVARDRGAVPALDELLQIGRASCRGRV